VWRRWPISTENLERARLSVWSVQLIRFNFIHHSGTDCAWTLGSQLILSDKLLTAYMHPKPFSSKSTPSPFP
jgi:hypothetical protein